MPIARALTEPNFHTRWSAVRRPSHTQVSRQWRSWLTDSGSLTKRLVQLSGGDFRVEVVRQSWQRPTRSEAKALRINSREFALIREVRLIGKDQAWVYARTIIPASTLTGRQRTLKLLGNRSLGTLLFGDPSMRRGPLQVSQLPLRESNTSVWARRSLFFLSDKPLLVCEVFLPALQEVN